MRPPALLSSTSDATRQLPGAASAAETQVTVGDDFFDPATARIQPGDTVNWRWVGSAQHNVRSFEGQTDTFRSGFLSGTGKTFSRTFHEFGRFTYYCEVHPDNMRGVVEVGTPPFPDTRVPSLTRVTSSTGRRTASPTTRVSSVRIRETSASK